LLFFAKTSVKVVVIYDSVAYEVVCSTSEQGQKGH
jgi:hypothetical protein